MSQLLIIDVQNTYKKHFSPNLLKDISDLCSNFSQIFYLYDDINGQDIHSEMPDEWLEDEKFYDSLNIMTKNYAFFRGLMDLGLDAEDEELVRLAKFMRKNKITDAREIEENLEVKEMFYKEFKNSPIMEISFDDYSFYLPEDLMEELESNIRNGVTLVGGGRNECLKEVALLLKVLDIDYSINEDLTY